MKIAVTAANGQLGSAIVHQLIQDVGPKSIVAIARTPAKAEHLGVEVRKGDYTQQQAFEQALTGIDAVCIISANGDPALRVPMHRNIIKAAKVCRVNKIVYTSVLGEEEGSSFSPIIQSNRQTERDIQASGLDWVIGRNGIYIEPDLEYIDTYVKEGGIKNSAADGKCAYTSRAELAVAYSHVLREDKHSRQLYNLVGEAVSQAELAELINQVYGTQLTYTSMTIEEYEAERKAALGEFLGTVIAGIYSSMRKGAYEVESHFESASGRPHKNPHQMIADFKSA
ncbi:MAG: NAD(P)H-binding protein [Bacteroidota bacterium]